MTDFDADWLSLRESADRRSRSPDLVAGLTAHLGDRPVRILDLGAGTGATLRAFARRFGQTQHWVLADSNAALLDDAQPVGAATLERRVIDLTAGLEELFDPIPDLVTASAFFDLCGPEWIDRLARCIAASGAVLYAALTYDGREVWEPPHSLDGEVLAAFHADQRRDKGLGPALGPGAHGYLAGSLRRAGYRLREATSDWRLVQPGDAPLIAALASGTAGAVASRIGKTRAEKWRAARATAHRVVIGHRDLLALPAGQTSE